VMTYFFKVGYRRVAKKITMSLQRFNPELIFKNFPSSDCFLKPRNMMLESLVIANQHVAVNLFRNLAHTARHGLGLFLDQRGRRSNFVKFFYIF